MSAASRVWDIESHGYRVRLIEKQGPIAARVEIRSGKRLVWRGPFVGHVGIRPDVEQTKAGMLAALREAESPVVLGGVTFVRGEVVVADVLCKHGLQTNTDHPCPRCTSARYVALLRLRVRRPGLGRAIPQDVKFRVAARSNGRCTKCGSGSDLQIDHIQAFSKGGSNAEHNLQLLCGRCNRRKGAK